MGLRWELESAVGLEAMFIDRGELRRRIYDRQCKSFFTLLHFEANAIFTGLRFVYTQAVTISSRNDREFDFYSNSVRHDRTLECTEYLSTFKRINSVLWPSLACKPQQAGQP